MSTIDCEAKRRASHRAREPSPYYIGDQRLFVHRIAEIAFMVIATDSADVPQVRMRGGKDDEIAVEFVRLKVDIIVTWGTSQVLAAKQATSVIPIVFATAGDPVGNNLVASPARPGGNATGLSNQMTDIAGKKLELLPRGRPRSRPFGDHGQCR